jgi:hypothetical protein
MYGALPLFPQMPSRRDCSQGQIGLWRILFSGFGYGVLTAVTIEFWPPLRSSGQSFWLQIQRSGFDSPLYQILREVMGLERGPLNLVNITEELLGRKSSGSGLESREYGRREPSGWPRGILYPQKLALTSPTSGGRSVGRYSSFAYSGNGD